MAQQTWTISGTLKVEESDISGTIKTRPLVNVEVQVMAANFGVFDSWGIVRTNSSGEFTLRKEKDKSKRKFKIKVRFEDSELKVVTGFLTNPINMEGPQFEVWETANEVDGPAVNAGTRTFKSGGSGDLGVLDNRRQATAWYAVNRLIDSLKDHDSWFAFSGKVHVVYPANTASGISYANGTTRCAYIHKGPNSDQWDIQTVFHEVMHIWNYDHNSGTSNWLAAVAWDLDTHGQSEEPYIAFHEGFAEFASHALLAAIWGSEGYRGEMLPYTRRYLYDDKGLHTTSAVEHNDDGTTHALRLLMASDLYTLRLGTRTGAGASGTYADRVANTGLSCPTPPNLTIWNILKVFQANAGAGWSTDWQVGNSSYGVLRFYERATDILSALTTAHKNLLLELLDPTSDVEANSRCSP